MNQPRTPRAPYPVTWATLICGVMCTFAVLAAARLDTAPARGVGPTLQSSATGDPLLAGAWIFA